MNSSSPLRRTCIQSGVRIVVKQSGIALIMALIALVAMSLTAMALIRSVDTGNIIAGNIALRQAALPAADIGFEAAFKSVQDMVTLAANQANAPAGCTTACSYYATTRDIEDPPGPDIPSTDIVVSSAPGVNPKVPINWDAVAAIPLPASFNGYTVKAVIDRLCSQAAFSSDDIEAYCHLVRRPDNCPPPPKTGDPDLCPAPKEIYYRVTVRVAGPRNTVVFSQMSFTRTAL